MQSLQCRLYATANPPQVPHLTVQHSLAAYGSEYKLHVILNVSINISTDMNLHQIIQLQVARGLQVHAQLAYKCIQHAHALAESCYSLHAEVRIPNSL